MCRNKYDDAIIISNNTFPHDWMGYWEGQLDIYNSSGLKQSLDMALDLDTITGDNMLKWTLIYDLQGNKDSREYC